MENIETEEPQRLVCTIYDQKIYDNRPLLDADTKEQWLLALRSGEYKQGNNWLCKDNKYCCLGVLCELKNELVTQGSMKYNFIHTACIAQQSSMYNVLGMAGDFKGFRIDKKECLAALNDNGYTFNEIADIIEQHF